MGKKVDTVVEIINHHFRESIAFCEEQIADPNNKHHIQAYENDIQVYETDWKNVISHINSELGTSYMTDMEIRNNNLIFDAINQFEKKQEEIRMENERLEEEQRQREIIREQRERERERRRERVRLEREYTRMRMSKGAKIALGAATFAGGFAAGRALGKKLM